MSANKLQYAGNHIVDVFLAMNPCSLSRYIIEPSMPKSQACSALEIMLHSQWATQIRGDSSILSVFLVFVESLTGALSHPILP